MDLPRTPKLKAFIVAYVLLAAAIVLLSVICPYGSRVFGLIRWWPIAGVLIASFSSFIFFAKGLLRFILPMQIALIVSVPIAAIVSGRNAIFVTELSGVVTQRYVGGHAAKGLEVQGNGGDIYHIEGVLENVWDSVSVGDSALKGRGGFGMTVGGRHVELPGWGSIRHRSPQSSSSSPP